MLKKETKKVTKKVVKKEVVVSAIITAPVAVENTVSDDSIKIINSISHPNKKILVEKILAGTSTEDLIKEYGNTRVSEMQKYIQNFSANLNKNLELKAKRGCNGVCLACQR